MRKRFEEFSLSLNPDKTRLIEFGRFAAERPAQRGLGKPEYPDRRFRRHAPKVGAVCGNPARTGSVSNDRPYRAS
jgi:hypothetical protein